MSQGIEAAGRGAAATERLSDDALRQRFAEDREGAWRAFIDAYTPVILGAIERAGIVDRDEAMEVYVWACERLAANDYAALRGRDPALGTMAGWLAVVIRRAVVDWVRSRAGRRRLFAAVRELSRLHQRLFELFYWKGRRPAEAAEVLSVEMKRRIGLDEVVEGMATIDAVLTARHRSELVSLAARAGTPEPLEGDDDRPGIDPPSETLDPEALLGAKEREATLAAVLATLPPEDAAIVSLKFVEGLTRPQIQSLLRLPELTEHRVRTLVATLRSRLAEAERGVADRPGRPARAFRTIPGGRDV